MRRRFQAKPLVVAAPADITAPTVPTNVAASALTATGFTLSWTASTDAVGVTGYTVQIDGVTYATPTTTSVAVTGRTGSTAYAVRVQARDAAGNFSALSTAITVTTPAAPDVTAPTVPTGVTISSITATGFTVSWTASTDAVGVTGYDVQIDGTSYATPTGTTVTVTGRTASTPYSVRVRARDAAGNFSALSTAVTVTTDVTTGLTVTSGLRGWWKADAISGAPADGAALTSWSDSSGGGNHPFTATTTAPTYVTSGTATPNGRAAVQFNGTSQQLVAGVPNNTPTTKFFVIRPAGFGSGSDIFNGSGGNGYEIGIGPGGKVDAWCGPLVVARTGGASGSPLALSVWQIVAFDGNGSNACNTYINGLQDGPTGTAAHTPAATGAVLGSGGGGGYFSGHIAEVIDYDRVLTDTERTTVTNYLTAKYAIGTAASAPMFRDVSFDSSESQALQTHPWSDFQISQPHQKAWITTPTRLGFGHSERFEVHNNTGDIVNGQAYRSMMDIYDTNEGGDTVGAVIGFPDVYWAMSFMYPTQAVTPSQAVVSAGFAQTTIPQYSSLFEFHERANINGSTVGINNVNSVTCHAVMVRDRNGVSQLQYRGSNGTWSWNAANSTWNQPSWSTFTPGTTGKNDQIPIPIVKPGGTDASMVGDVWIDVIFRVKFAKDSTGVVQIWARQAGQAFTTAANLTINGPTHKVVVGSDGVTRTSADYEDTRGSYGGTGQYAHCGIYMGSNTWDDSANQANVIIMDEIRRWGTLAEAKNNWGGV